MPTDDQLTKLEASFEAFSRRYKLAEAVGAEKPVNELDKQVLFYVSRHPGCGPTDIARFLGVPATTTTSATDRLVKRGFVDRARPEQDRRAVALRLTAAGTAQVNATSLAYRDLCRRMLAPLSGAEQEVLIGLMEKIVKDDD